MEKQNLGNHARIAPKTYYLASLMALAVIILSLVYSKNMTAKWEGYLLPFSLLCLALGLLFATWYARAFALKAQDRAIRAEENLRHFSLTGKLLDSRLKISQIIALRFASDEELVQLARKAAEENMTNKEIKSAIKNWKGDYYRV